MGNKLAQRVQTWAGTELRSILWKKLVQQVVQEKTAQERMSDQWRRGGRKGWTTWIGNQDGAGKWGDKEAMGHQASDDFWGRQNCNPPRTPITHTTYVALSDVQVCCATVQVDLYISCTCFMRVWQGHKCGRFDWNVTWWQSVYGTFFLRPKGSCLSKRGQVKRE